MTDPTRGDVDMVGDLVHPGHVDLLRAARALGDQLVVGVRSDETCAAYKRRPIMTLDERVAVIEACRYVDEVIPDSPFRLTMDFLEEHDLSLVVHGDDLNADGVADVYGPVSEAGQVCSGSSRAGAGSPQLASWRGYVTKARPLTSRQRARPTWPRRRALRLTRSTSSGFGATRWRQTGSQRRFDSAAWTQPPQHRDPLGRTTPAAAAAFEPVGPRTAFSRHGSGTHGSLGGEMPLISKGQPEVDYAGFVDREWAALYRTAYLLTGDHQRADAIVQTALMKVCLAWPRVAAMQHPEIYTRRLMVSQLTSWWHRTTRREPPGLTLVEPVQPVFDDRVAPSSEIWSLVLDLRPRQRAVVVLRYYEDRSDPEMAEILGVTSETVNTHARQALEALRSQLGATADGVVNVDELLTQSAHRVAGEVLPPSAPSARELCARARTRRLRRIGTAAVATAAAVIAAAALVPVLRGQPDEEKVDDTRPRLGSVPAWMDSVGDIHVGDDVLDLPAFPLNPSWGVTYPEPSFALTATGVVWPARAWNGPLYWQPLDGEPIPLTEETPLSYTADPLGDHVVWITNGGDIVTYDVGERRTVDTSTIQGPLDDKTSGPILFVSDDRVVYEAGGAVWVLDLTAKSTSRMPDVTSSDLLDYGNGVSVVATSQPPNRGAPGAHNLTDVEFRTDAGPVQAETGPLLRGGRLSPDGKWFVTSTGYELGPRPVVLDTRTGEQVPIDLPERMIGAYAAPWGWAGADVLLISLKLPDSGYGLLWTCQPAIGACERLLSDAPLDAHPG